MKQIDMIIRMIMVMIFVAAGALVQAQQVQWEQTNGPLGASIQSFYARGDGLLLAGTATDGQFFISADEGENWRLIDVVDTTSIALLTGINNTLFYSDHRSGGLYRSDDDGTSWQMMAQFTKQFEWGKSPDAPEYLARNVQGNFFVVTKNGDIHRSTDNGSSWENVTANFPSENDQYISGLVVHPNGTLFASVIVWGADYTITGKVHQSTNNGDSWTETTFPDTVQGSDLQMNASGDLFASGWNQLLRSTNAGASWENMDGWMPDNGEADINAFSISDDGRCYILATIFGDTDIVTSIFLSNDNGDTWSVMDYPSGFHASRLRASGNNALYLIGGAKFFRSNDDGTSWATLENGLLGAAVAELKMNHAGELFAAAYDHGLLYSDDDGNTWQKTNFNENTGAHHMGISPEGHLFVSTIFTMHRSTDKGITWENLSEGIPEFSPAMDYAFHPNGDIFIAIYGHGVYRSEDNGDSWLSISNGFPTEYRAIALAINSQGHIFAGGDGFEGIFRSMDNGENWTEHKPGLTRTFVRDIEITANDDIFIGVGGDYFRSGWIFRSTTNGNVFTKVDNGLTLPTDPLDSGEEEVASLFSLPNGDLYAGTTHGIFHSANNGDEWVQMNEGLKYGLLVTSLMANTSGRIFAGTAGYSVFRSVSPATAISDNITTIPGRFELSQNYPNPFNPTTTIRFSLPVASEVSLKIYDMNGRLVRTLVAESQAAGQHAVEWDGRDQRGNSIASGIYLYRMTAGEFSQTKRMIFLK